MISKEAQKSIKTYRRIASFFGFLYRTPNEMTKGRLGFARWFNNLAGTINPKVTGTVKEEVYFGDIRTFKVSTPNSNPEKILLYFQILYLIFFLVHPFAKTRQACFLYLFLHARTMRFYQNMALIYQEY